MYEQGQLCTNNDNFKNRRTVARVRHVKNLKTFTGYIQLKNFKLSAVRLQPSMDKNGKNDDYNKYKIGETIKRIYQNGRKICI